MSRTKKPKRSWPGRTMVSLLVPDDVLSQVDGIAKRERRSRSQQIVLLCEVAMAARHGQKREE